MNALKPASFVNWTVKSSSVQTFIRKVAHVWIEMTREFMNPNAES